jgi:hypothetical protein
MGASRKPLNSKKAFQKFWLQSFKKIKIVEILRPSNANSQVKFSRFFELN